MSYEYKSCSVHDRLELIGAFQSELTKMRAAFRLYWTHQNTGAVADSWRRSTGRWMSSSFSGDLTIARAWNSKIWKKLEITFNQSMNQSELFKLVYQISRTVQLLGAPPPGACFFGGEGGLSPSPPFRGFARRPRLAPRSLICPCVFKILDAPLRGLPRLSRDQSNNNRFTSRHQQ